MPRGHDWREPATAQEKSSPSSVTELKKSVEDFELQEELPLIAPPTLSEQKRFFISLKNSGTNCAILSVLPDHMLRDDDTNLNEQQVNMTLDDTFSHRVLAELCTSKKEIHLAS